MATGVYFKSYKCHLDDDMSFFCPVCTMAFVVYSISHGKPLLYMEVFYIIILSKMYLMTGINLAVIKPLYSQ